MADKLTNVEGHFSGSTPGVGVTQMGVYDMVEVTEAPVRGQVVVRTFPGEKMPHVDVTHGRLKLTNEEQVQLTEEAQSRFNLEVLSENEVLAKFRSRRGDTVNMYWQKQYGDSTGPWERAGKTERFKS